MLSKIFFTLNLLILVASVGVGVWASAYKSALGELDRSGQENLSQAVDQFRAYISTARVLPTLIARNSTVIDSVQRGEFDEELLEYLTLAHELGNAFEVRILNKSGIELLSTARDDTLVRRSDKNYFQTAMSGALGVAISYDDHGETRTLTYARSIINSKDQQIGAVVVDVNLERLETEFRARSDVFLLLDKNETVIFSNRNELLFRRLVARSSNPDEISRSASFPIGMLADLVVDEDRFGPIDLWRNLPEAPSPAPLIVNKQQILSLALEAILLVDSQTASKTANKIVWLYLVIIALMITLTLAIYQRRKHLVERLKANQKLNDELDRRVTLKNKELEQAQSQLIQAAKLSALGKMSAGISHELNQPISSIQNFAVNATRFLNVGKVNQTLENLVDIEEQTVRMSRIIKNLRNFARSDSRPTTVVSISKVIESAAQMSDHRLQQEAVVLSLPNIAKDIFVIGGEVRLQQVLINLISNAIDALAHQNEKHIDIELDESNRDVTLQISDNGPGLLDPDRVFEPFYTTKSGPTDDGLGLGLSISYGFVESFGGTLRASNLATGGALFTLSLPKFEKQKSKNE
ncbi:MAG: hypothetical protein K5905_22880 [Roseibium sp.]|uniref:sensor histidine kinase n=1 Tax=Roseibium sp. TaxID=1936156 RepID=UPI002602A780|nr:ATP-binding protein [Roseibium sp.]MCV0428312.1 hypothetical protein [Roseibium sp.]